MIVEANVRYWTPEGMQSKPSMGGSLVRYVEATEVERLLEEAHRHGWVSAEAALKEKK